MAERKRFMSANGYTTVYLVVNMNKFVEEDDLGRFEAARGTEALANTIKHDWHSILSRSDTPFVAQEQFVDEPDTSGESQAPRMSVDEVAFVTGIFKGAVLRNYSMPFYKVEKERFKFDPILSTNYQFKSLFLEQWNRWDIHIRPTMTGMFIVRLTDYYDDRYGTQPAEFRTIASNVQGLQSSFDVPSAIEYQSQLQDLINRGDTDAPRKLRTVEALLDWLSAERAATSSLDYPRVQWQLTQEVCLRFIEAIGQKLHLPNRKTIRLTRPKRNITTSQNDSFVVYHFNELYAPGRLIVRDYWSDDEWKEKQNDTFTLHARDLAQSPRLREGVVQLIEGAMLKRPSSGPDSSGRDTRRFPRQKQADVDRVFEQNRSTWEDELCLLTARCCVVWPSRGARKDELFISTLPTITSRVKYIWYWEAMERMFEFIIEIKLMCSMVEHESVKALDRFSDTVSRMRRELLTDRFKPRRTELANLSRDAANLSRLVALSHGLSTPQTWSRAEYAASKADYLMEQLSIPQLLKHAESNVENMTDLINHQDELYLANLSERSNVENRRLNGLFSFLSVILVIYALPSFWADSAELFSQRREFVWGVGIFDFTYWLGNIAAPIILLFGLYWFVRSRTQRNGRERLLKRRR